MMQFWVRRLTVIMVVLGAIAACAPPEEESTSGSARYDDSPITERQGNSPSPPRDSLPTAPENRPTPPSPTPSPTTNVPKLSVVKEWQTIQGNGVQLDVPDFYDGGNPSAEYDDLVAKLTAIHPNYAERLAAIADQPDAIALLAFDAQESDGEFLTNVNVATEAVGADVTLEDYVRAASQQLAQAYQIQSQSIVSIGPHRAGQIVGEIQNNAVLVKQLFYMIPHDGKIWIITYATPAAEFEQRLNEFTQSIQSVQFSP